MFADSMQSTAATTTRLTLQMSSLTAMCLSAEQSGAARGGDVTPSASAFISANSAAAAPSCASVRAFWNDLQVGKIRARDRIRDPRTGLGLGSSSGYVMVEMNEGRG